MNPDLFYLIALSNTAGIGSVTAKQLIAHCGSAQAVFSTPRNTLLAIPGIGKKTAEALLTKSGFACAEAEMNFLAQYHIQAHSYLESSYPRRLKACEDGPVVLYQKGTLNLNAKRILAIVGTRNATHYGLDFCARFVENLRPLDVVIISGLAYGIDAAAHREALKHNIPTAAILAHGLDRVYPSLHHSLARQMADQGGALLTEYGQNTIPDRENFPKRNRIVAGICDAIVIVEAAKKGGALITAEIANSYHRDVFAVPGRVGDTFSAGCNHFIKTHKAALLTDVHDLEYLLGWKKQTTSSAQTRLFETLTPLEQSLLHNIQQAPNQLCSLEALCQAAQLPVSKILSTLMNLEIKGLVKNLPGKIYTFPSYNT
jgi:DNA processing protein